MNDPFYKTRQWEMIRNRVLRRDGYMCQMSKRYGKMVEANTVHHIFPRKEFPEYAWKDWNLISLSAEQHERMHYRKTEQLTATGAELLRRTAMRQGIGIPEQYR